MSKLLNNVLKKIVEFYFCFWRRHSDGEEMVSGVIFISCFGIKETVFNIHICVNLSLKSRTTTEIIIF